MKIIIWFAVLFFSFLTSAGTNSDISTILDKEDLVLELQDRKGPPALSSTLNQVNKWESYNQWMCVPSDWVSVVQFKIEYDGIAKNMPQVEFWVGNHLFEITLSADTNYDNQAIYKRWQNMIESHSEVCVYAAFLQNLKVENAEGSLWIISRFKSANDYWVEGEEANNR